MREAKSHYYRQKIDACKATDPEMGWKIIHLLTGKANKITLINDILVNDCLSFTSNLRQLVRKSGQLKIFGRGSFSCYSKGL